jgi:hypothetical protein
MSEKCSLHRLMRVLSDMERKGEQSRTVYCAIKTPVGIGVGVKFRIEIGLEGRPDRRRMRWYR